jgi:hypothetical protein
MSDKFEDEVQAAFPDRYRDGMTLRDYFAAKAMQRLLTDDEIDVSYATAVLSYRMADEMMKAREKA